MVSASSFFFRASNNEQRATSAVILLSTLAQIIESFFTFRSDDALVDTAAGQSLIGPGALEEVTRALSSAGLYPITIPQEDLPTAKGVGRGVRPTAVVLVPCNFAPREMLFQESWSSF